MGLSTGEAPRHAVVSAAHTRVTAGEGGGMGMTAHATVGIRFYGSLSRGKHYQRKLAKAMIAARDEVIDEMRHDRNLKDVMPL